MGENKLKKRFSGILTCAMVATLMPTTPIAATSVQTVQLDGASSETTTGSMIEITEMTEATQVTTSSAITIGDWNTSAFGNGVVAEEHTTVVEGDVITMTSNNEKNAAGKISGDKDGINFFYQELEAESNFEIKVKAKVAGLYGSANSQVSFGLMLRDTVGTHGETGSLEIQGAKMLGVGNLSQKMISYARTTEKGKFAAGNTFSSSNATAGTTYELGIKKSGDYYEFSIDGVVTQAYYRDQFDDKLYAGIYTARAVSVEYTDLELIMAESVSSLTIESQPDKTIYLEDEALDLSGLVVKADGEEVAHEDLIVIGYDSKTVGTQQISIHYGGASTSFEVEVQKLTCTALDVTITPAKTTYYIDDAFDTTGMVIEATYNSGKVVKVSEAEYEMGEVDLSTPGIKTVTVSFDGQTTEFNITVLADELKELEIAKMPSKTLYFIGEDFEEKGMAIKAIYGDTKILLEQKEYIVDASNFDSSVAGGQTVTVIHKTKSIEVPVTVKAKEATRVQVTTLPKTTYEVGGSFDPTGIEVSKVFDNGETMALAPEAYTLDTSAFDGSQAGSYIIQVIPQDTAFKPVSFTVAVREPITYDWNYVTFGQSISTEKNYVEHLENGGVKLVALEGGGKITNSFQDGITYYYTELDNASDNFTLTADIVVNAFAKPTPDNQEGFGIMARDAIGTHGDASVFYSNIAAVGGYRGATQMVMRSGVTASDSTGAATGYQEEIKLNDARPALSNTNPAGTYRLTLKKDNTGYTGSITTPTGTKKHLSYQPDALGTQNDKLYVGFYAARLADIDVYNINLEVTAAEADAPKVEAPEQAVNPSFSFSSLSASALTDYDLKMYANVNGTVTIKQGETIIGRDIPVAGGTIYEHPTKLTENAVNNFTVTFTPDTDQNLTSYNKIVKSLAVEMKTYGTEGEAIYVSPAGKSTGEGTLDSPLSIDRALSFVKPGQTVYLLEGDYELTKAIGIAAGNNGTADAVKTLAAYPGAKVTINAGKKVSGFNLDGDYWHIYGIDFTGAVSTGFRVGGNHNIVELCNFYSNGDTGLQISRYGNGGYDTWPANNLILNCTSYDNIDASENNADGFAAKLTSGPGNVFKGCISHNNIDDAWDLFAKGSTGPIGAVTLEDCIAYSNGTLTNGYVGKGDKNGFKLGGEGIAVPHVIKNSIAFNNGATGFSSNSNPAVISENCVSYDNEGANFDWRVYTDVTPQFVATGNVSYRSEAGPKDVYPTSLENSSNFYYDGEKSANSAGVVLTDKNFKSLDVPTAFDRDEKGNIIFGDFLSFIPPTSGGNSDDDDYVGGGSSNQGSNIAGTNENTGEKVHTVVTEAISSGKMPEVTVTPAKPKVEINKTTIEELVQSAVSFKINAQQVSLTLSSEFLSGNILSKVENLETVQVTAAPLSNDVFNTINAQLKKEGKMTVVGDTALTTVVEVKAGEALKTFNEPLTVAFDLSGVKVTEPGKLTLVKYELQKDGSYKVTKLGGHYDLATKTLTARTDAAGIYGVVEAEELLKINMTIGKANSVVNDQTLTNDVAPQIMDGSTMVPVRFIAENLGAEVKWNHKNKQVEITLQGETISVSSQDGMLIKDARTLVPIRQVSEKLGANVLWINSSKEIEIVK